MTTTSSINTSGIKVGNDGKISVSGFSSGIDWKSIVDAQIKADRSPAVQLETKISKNKELITAYGELKTKVASVTSSLDALRGAPGSSVDVFKSKTVTGSSAASVGAPAGYTPSSADSMALYSVSSKAQSATHTLVVHQLAQAHQLRSGAFSSTGSALTTLGATAGTFSVNGKSVVLDSTDTLADVKDKINNSGAGVTATIVSASATTHYLVLSSDKAGTSNQITLGGSGATLDSLGLTSGDGAAIAHELVAAQNAKIDVDGITGIERATNQIDDVVAGVTFSLLKADANTTVTLKIEPDLASIKTAVGNFVTAYNALRTYATDQRTAKDRNNDGTVDTGEVGPLAFDTTMRSVINKLGDIMAASVDGNTDGFRTLGQIGVVVGKDYSLTIDDSVIDNKLLTNVDAVRNLFAFNVTTGDGRLTTLARTKDTASGTYYLNMAGTDADGNLTGASFAAASGAGYLDDGSATVSGATLTAASGGAKGLKMFFNGEPSLGAISDIQVKVSRGLGDLFFDYFNDMTTATSGRFDTLVTDLQTQNSDYQGRIDTIDSRLENERTSLTNKYLAMETAMAKLENIKQSVSSYYDAMNSKSS